MTATLAHGDDYGRSTSGTPARPDLTGFEIGVFRFLGLPLGRGLGTPADARDVLSAGVQLGSTAGLPFTRSTAPCTAYASCTDGTGYRTDSTRCAWIIRSAVPRTVPRPRPIRPIIPATVCNPIVGTVSLSAIRRAGQARPSGTLPGIRLLAIM